MPGVPPMPPAQQPAPPQREVSTEVRLARTALLRPTLRNLVNRPCPSSATGQNALTCDTGPGGGEICERVRQQGGGKAQNPAHSLPLHVFPGHNALTVRFATVLSWLPLIR